MEIWEKLGWHDYALWSDRLSNPRNLLKLASNPFILAMLFSVWLRRRQLPQNRADLFRRFVDTLLIRELLYGTADGDRLLKGLAELAWRMQRERIASREAESPEDFYVLTVASPDRHENFFRASSVAPIHNAAGPRYRPSEHG